MIRLRIAASRLFRFLGKVRVEAVDSPICDLIVTNLLEHFSFGVKVGSSGVLDTQSYSDYFDYLSSLSSDQFKMPLVLAAVNEDAEDVRIGMLTKFRLGHLTLFRKPGMVKFTEENSEILYDNIKSMDGVIRALSNPNWGVLKDWSIAKHLRNGRISEAHVIYMRTFSDGYKMLQKEIVDERERFERYFRGIPEEEYPRDMLDDIIGEGLKSIYTDSEIRVRNSLLLFNTELDDLRQRLSLYASPVSVQLILEPNLDGNVWEMEGFKFVPVRIQLELYPPHAPFNQDWVDEVAQSPIDLEEWRKQEGDYLALLPTLKNPGSFVF